MPTIEQIQRDILELSPTEFRRLCDWVLERDWESWDAQIASDLAAGRLDEIIAEALQDATTGVTRRR
jgi:hypothetical protein